MTRPEEDLVDVPFVIRRRLEELGLEQQALARAAHVTESYISQLLTRRKAPPAPNRTDIYDRMDKFLKLPSGELAKLADLQRKEELKRELGDEPAPLFLDTDIFHLSAENCVAFLDPLIESWDIDLATFGLEIVLNHSLVPGQAKRFAFVERDAEQPRREEPGLQEFLQDSSLSGSATAG